MTKSVKKADTGSNVSNERTNLIAEAAQRVQQQRKEQGSNAFISDTVSESLIAQAHLDSLASEAGERATIGLGETVTNLMESGHTSLDYTQAKAKDFTLGKDDPWFKKRKDFYDNAKAVTTFGHVTGKDYGLPGKFLERGEFYRIYRAKKSELSNEGLQPAIFVALETAKNDANQTIRKIRERMITIEKGDDKTPKVESTNFEKDLKDFQRLINRLLSREDLPADEVKHKLIALKQAAGSGGYGFIHDLKFDVE